MRSRGVCSRSPRHSQARGQAELSLWAQHRGCPPQDPQCHSPCAKGTEVHCCSGLLLLSAAAPAWAPAQPAATSQDTAPSCAWPKGSSCGTRETQTSPGAAVPAPEFKAGRRPCGSKGSTVGNHPQPWIGCRADGRTHSTRISVSHNLSPHSLPHLTFSSRGADLHLAKAIRNTGRVSKRQVVFCSEHHQGHYTRSRGIFFFFLKLQAAFVLFCAIFKAVNEKLFYF